MFILIHTQTISAIWPIAESLQTAGDWFSFHSRSPYSAATMAGLLGAGVTVCVSRAGGNDAVS